MGFTPEGERVVVWARRILAERDALRDDLATMRSGLTGVLRLAAIPTAVTTASLLTSSFCADHPHARVSLESASSREIVHRLADFDLDVGMTYLDGEPLGEGVRTVPLYRERYLLLTPDDGELGARASVGWAEAAGQPLCLLTPEMQNRRIIDGLFARAGVTPTPSVETDTVSALYAHVGTHRWSAVVAHVWLHLFGVPAGMRVIPLEEPASHGRAAPDSAYRPLVGLVLADREPEPILAAALLEVAGRIDVAALMDALLDEQLSRP
jgi:DNA-binding transcriptional LysR family regulator